MSKTLNAPATPEAPARTGEEVKSMFTPGWLFENMLEVRLYIALPVAGVFRTVWLNSL